MAIVHEYIERTCSAREAGLCKDLEARSFAARRPAGHRSWGKQAPSRLFGGHIPRRRSAPRCRPFRLKAASIQGKGLSNFDHFQTNPFGGEFSDLIRTLETDKSVFSLSGNKTMTDRAGTRRAGAAARVIVPKKTPTAVNRRRPGDGSAALPAYRRTVC